MLVNRESCADRACRTVPVNNQHGRFENAEPESAGHMTFGLLALVAYRRQFAAWTVQRVVLAYRAFPLKSRAKG